MNQFNNWWAETRRFMYKRLAVALCLLFVVMAGASTAYAKENNGCNGRGCEQPKKVNICHANNGNGTDGFVLNNVNDDSVDGNTGNDHGNGDHNRNGHQGGRDIIPPFYDDGTPGHWSARNWDAVGKATFYNDCKTPKVATAAIDVEPATCDFGQKLVYGTIKNATFSGTANGTTGPAAYSVTATANNDSLFAGSVATKVFKGSLSGPLTGEDCEGEPELKANITATGVCELIDGKSMVVITLKNTGDKSGTVQVNGKDVTVEAGKEVVKSYPAANGEVEVVIDGKTKTFKCEGGSGNQETPKTPQTPETPKTPESPKTSETPVVLPYTAGASTPVVAVSALTLASVILVAGAAIKSRLLS